MLQWLYMYVVNFCSQCFICFSGVRYKCIWMLQNTYVTSVLSGCCVYFTMAFKCFCKCFICMFKCFICLQTYVASVASRCFKSRSGVAFPSSLSAASPRCLLFLLAPAGYPPSPAPLLDSSDARGPVGPACVRETAGNRL
jgi:hypothetical protein